MTSRRGQESGPELVFELKWKRPAKSSVKREDNRASIGIWDTPDNTDTTLDLLSFKSYLCQNLGASGDVAVSYVDSDGDELPIDSQCEFLEALKFARARAKKDKNVLLLIDKIDKENSGPVKFFKEPSSADSDRLFVFKAKPQSSTPKNIMPPISVSGIVERVSEMTLDELNTSAPPLPASSEIAPPAWFKNYMEMLKTEIVAEVSTKVMANVMEVMCNHISDPCPSCSRRSERRGRYSRELHSEEKQQRRKKKRVVEEVDSSDALPSPQQKDTELLRKVKRIEKRERKLEKKLDDKLEWMEQKTRCILEKKKRCLEASSVSNNLNKEASFTKPAAATEVASTPPHLTDIKEDDFAKNPGGCAEGRVRMSCSITGHEMLDKPALKSLECYSDSDSDNISIISASDFEHENNFEMVPMPSCFILDKPLNNCEPPDAKNPETLDNSPTISPNPSSHNLNFVVCEAESDRNNNQDSPSYELLSEPPSPASSIHEDLRPAHCNFTLNSDLIDFNHDDHDSKKTGAYVVDMHGKIFDDKRLNESEEDMPINLCKRPKVNEIFEDKDLNESGDDSPANLLNDDNESDEDLPINLYKRPGGAYSYINETLPSHNEAVNPPIFGSEAQNEQPVADNLNLNMKSSHPSYGGKKDKFAANKSETPLAINLSVFQSQTDLGAGSHESTQSFSSHTSRGRSNDPFYQVHTRASYSGPNYSFVDRNVSKGLGETKYSSCKKDRSPEVHKKEEGTNETGGKYQRGFTSECSACVFTEQPRRSGINLTAAPRESTPEAGRGPTDPVHILPETLVSGAVQVASSAYSTARKVFDKIRNMQTVILDELDVIKFSHATRTLLDLFKMECMHNWPRSHPNVRKEN